jgi:hypothetical protein
MDFHCVDGSDNPARVLEAIEAALGLALWQSTAARGSRVAC